MEPPLGYRKEPSLFELVQLQVHNARIRELEEAFGAETEEEADDFVVDDEMEPFSPHENDGAPTVAELRAEIQRMEEEAALAASKRAIDQHYERYPHLERPELPRGGRAGSTEKEAGEGEIPRGAGPKPE